MKKLFSLFVPLMALFLTLAPQTVRAQINEYLKLTSSKITVNFIGTPNVDLWYSENKSTWTPITESGTVVYQGNNTKTYYFKGDNGTNGFCKDANNYVTFVLNGGTISGNVMSLVNSTNDNPTEFITNSTIPTDYCFYSLFRNNTSTNNLNASALSLPAEYLTDYCYAYMFRSCTGLSQVPALPSTNLAPYCYAHMFEDCQNALFKTLPALPAVELEEGCYSYMFNLCPSLTNSDWYILPAEELAPYCYYQMFGLTMPNGNSTKSGKCTTLQKVEIMATSLQDRYGNDITNCMARMFNYMTVATTNTAYYGRGGLTLRFYWTNWGNGTTGASTATSTAPTCDWFTGLMSSYCTFQYQTGLNITATASDNTSSTKAHTFPKSSTLTAQSYTYLTFNCAANDGTWEEGSAYNTDLRRVVRADYTAKTIPAPPVKAGHRFIGWFTTANDNEEVGSLLTEEYLKTITTATTVYARFVDNNTYTLYIAPNDHATITASDGTNNYSAGQFYILDNNAATYTISYSNAESGFNFYKYTRNGVEQTANTVTFNDDFDLVLGGIFTRDSGSSAKNVTVYQVGTNAGMSKVFDLPSQAVDLGDAGIWAKYNVDANQKGGFATSETAAGSYFSWGMLGVATGQATPASTYGWYDGVWSMSNGDNLPVTDERDAAYHFCGSPWRIPTKEEFQKLIDNTTQSTVGSSNRNQTFTSKTDPSKSIVLPKNGYKSGSYSYQTNSLDYWTSTVASVSPNNNAGYNSAYGYAASSNGGTPSLGTTVGGYGYIHYGAGIRPIYDIDAKTLTVHSGSYDYIFKCDLDQQVTITAESDEDNAQIFIHWEDGNGNIVSISNPMVVKMYDNLTYTAVYADDPLAKRHWATFYDYDGTQMERKEVIENVTIKYTGGAPTRSGWEFTGWSPALGKMGTEDVSFTAQYIQLFTLNLSGTDMSFTMTADGYDDQTTSGTYRNGTEVTITATSTNEAYRFTSWSDGNTDNPRTFTLGANTNLTTNRGISSVDQSVSIYQVSNMAETRILYNLDAKIGADGKTYQPVDMGYGVAWADRNVSATSSAQVGEYFYWGGTEPGVGGYTGYFYDTYTKNTPANYTLLPAEDAATVTMGASWHMPTNAEWSDILTNSTYSSGTLTSNINGNSIFLPAGGYRNSGSLLESTARYYWTSQLNSRATSSYSKYKSTAWVIYDGEGTLADGYDMWSYNDAPIRAVYSPSYTTYTLTVVVNGVNHIYICQAGQTVTVTAVPDQSYVFDKWSDDNSTNPVRAFTMNANKTVTAQFKDDPEAALHDVIFYDSDGVTVLDRQNNVPEGRTIVYGGAMPAHFGYDFTGWDKAVGRVSATQANNIFTATFALIESADASVDIYQNVSADATKILYNLNAKTGADNKTYQPIDMGYGVAWADRDLGANGTNSNGSFVRWGKTTTGATDSYYNTNLHSAGYILDPAEDAAHVIMGDRWRIPTLAEWQTLIENSTYNNTAVTATSNKNGNVLNLRKAGYSSNGTGTSSTSTIYYWTSRMYSTGSPGKANIMRTYNSALDASYTMTVDNYLFVRAIYEPTYTTHTLTIHVGDYTYEYICQYGQSVTVTPHASSTYVFNEWSDNHSTTAVRTFAIDGDIEVTATFKDDPDAPTHTVTFNDYNDTQLASYTVIEGRTPVYKGATPTREGYIFTGWTPAITVLGNSDVTYTATYKEKPVLFTITNTHATTATTVNMYRTNYSYTPKPTLYIRISDKNNNVTTDWTQKNITSGGNNQLGSIPAGGKMEIYGNNSAGFGYSNTSYYANFSMTEGTVEIGGNILSLVACSDGGNIDNTFTMPAWCFFNLFNGCTILTSAEELELPSTTLSEYCYAQMFMGCTALTKAPKELPATGSMPRACYKNMFKNCSTLVASPDIHATSFYYNNVSSGELGAEYGMFGADVVLSKMRVYLSAWGNGGMETGYWVNNITNTGDFYCPPTLARTHAHNKIPTNFTVYSYNLTFVAKGGGNWSDGTNSNKQFTWMTDKTDVTDFLANEDAVVGYYTNEACTTPITKAEIVALLSTQKESNTNTTKYIYASIPVTGYTLAWDANGGSLNSDGTPAGTVNGGATIIAPTGSKTGYYLSGWSPAFTGTMPAANTKYVAQWEINKYTVTIAKNEDDWGTLTDESENVRVINNVPYGTTISNSGATVTINGTTVTATPAAVTAQYTYGFDSWTNGTETVTGDMTVTANFTRTTNTYDITWKSEDGTSTLDTDEAQPYGTATSYIGATPTKSATGYTYAFDGWATEANGAKVYNIGETPTVSGATTYYAHFTGTVNTHTLTWVANGGTLTGGTEAGTTAYGTDLTAPTATRAGYTFNGWSPSVPAKMPDDNATYTAQWNRIEYTITYNELNGATNSNNPISYNIESETITLADPGTRNGYVFAGWKDKSDNTITQITQGSTGDLTLTATWNAKSSDITLCENCDNDHYTALKTNYNGETVNVTYPRQFAANRWSTMCLPFSIELPEMITQKMYGRVYEFKYATGNANTNSGVNLYFSNAKKIEAGTCYIVNANDALAAKTSFVFSGVTIDLSKDKDAALTSVGAYNNLPGYKSEGTIELVGTLRNGTLHGTATGNKYMGLKDNKIYYPNISQGSTIWAYRGIFRSSKALDIKNMQKMRIIVDGEDMGELIVDEDGEILDASGNAESRKFIENGVLYIERNGVIYDATGKRVELDK